jgi:hypothetical protein
MTNLPIDLECVALDSEGRVILRDADLDALVQEYSLTSAGGTNTSCGGTNNPSCSNSNCGGSKNDQCTNSGGCDSSVNYACKNQVIGIGDGG